ncbi:MAG: hypothetical protein IT385_03795 [Deltaproteobacteria bacterium]|nr:hypothetical protein [Deltaproteobacteria bacterium]
MLYHARMSRFFAIVGHAALALVLACDVSADVRPADTTVADVIGDIPSSDSIAAPPEDGSDGADHLPGEDDGPPDVEPETDVETVTDVEPETEIEAETENETENDTETESETETDAETETDVVVPETDVVPETTDLADPVDGCTHTGSCVDPLAALSDDFEDATTLSRWSILSEVTGTPALHDVLDVDTTIAGALVMDPNRYVPSGLPNPPTGAGWFEDYKGPFAYKLVTGDFVVIAHVQVGTTTDESARPSGLFNAAGLVARDPSGSAPGDESWIMFNIGRQATSFASESKTTYPAAPGGSYSRSTLFLTPIAASGNSARLAMCRLGDRFYFFRSMDSSPGWVQEVHTPGNVYYDGAGLAGVGYEAGFERADLPATLQVGLIANRWGEGAAPPRAVFSRLSFATPSTLADCTPPE